MKKLLLGALMMAGVTGTALADDGWQNNSAYNKMFNPATVATFSGTVEKINRSVVPLKGMAPGFEATIKTAKGEHIAVQVGPAWFTTFYRHQWNAQVGDQVKVIGSKVSVNGHPVVMAISGEKGNLRMTVRDKHGAPIWDFPVQGF